MSEHSGYYKARGSYPEDLLDDLIKSKGNLTGEIFTAEILIEYRKLCAMGRVHWYGYIPL